MLARLRADVSEQQGVFDVLPVGFGELILGEDVEQGFAERVAGLGQASLEALHAGAGGFGGFHHGFRDGRFLGRGRYCRYRRLLCLDRRRSGNLSRGRAHFGMLRMVGIGIAGVLGVFGGELHSLCHGLVGGPFHGPFRSLAEPPCANDDGRDDDHGHNNRNNHIRIHGSSLKSATDTLPPPRGRTTNVRFTKGIRCSTMQGIEVST